MGKLLDEGLHNCKSSVAVIKGKKLRKMRWLEYVARIWEENKCLQPFCGGGD